MDKLEQIFALDKLLRKRRTPIPRSELETALGLKRATTTRLLAHCRNILRMPIEFDREHDGYHYSKTSKDNYQLPGFWFNESELLALMTSHRLLADVQPGILQPWLEPLQTRIEQLLEHKCLGSKAVFERIRIVPMANRAAKLEDFQQVAAALIKRKQVRIAHSNRSSGKLSDRWISPQRLLYYRDNWYLDAWCHSRNALRTFSLDALHVLETGGNAKDINDKQLDQTVKSTYGIFAGQETAKAVIHFSSDAARWVADELWHPDQQSRHLQDGKWELVVPYSNPTELIRDIIKYGPEAEVIAPPELRKLVEDQLSKTLKNYRKSK